MVLVSQRMRYLCRLVHNSTSPVPCAQRDNTTRTPTCRDAHTHTQRHSSLRTPDIRETTNTNTRTVLLLSCRLRMASCFHASHDNTSITSIAGWIWFLITPKLCLWGVSAARWRCFVCVRVCVRWLECITSCICTYSLVCVSESCSWHKHAHTHTRDNDTHTRDNDTHTQHSCNTRA